MKRVVSVSLGSPSRDKKVEINLGGQQIMVERIGTGGDPAKARQLFTELDGKADVLTVGGIDLYVRLDGRDYPVRSALKLVENVKQTTLVDGRFLKYALERRFFELGKGFFPGLPHFRKTLIPSAIDRVGLLEAVTSVSNEVYICDLVFMLGIPWVIKGRAGFLRIARAILPVAGFFPIRWILPPGSKDEAPRPKMENLWQEADLIAGDMHYIRKYGSNNLSGKVIITNTTTPENIQLMRQRGVKTLFTTTPIYEGRTFGVNVMEGVLTAYAGFGRGLTFAELNQLIDELELAPTLIFDGN